MADVYAANASDIDINSIFKEFGYTPTDAEAQALAGAFGGANNAATKAAGVNAIGQYVNYMNQIKQFEANDPLKGLQTQMDNIITQNTASVQNLSTQLQDTLKAAPQLFGSLTPDQIKDYLAPTQTSFNQQIAKIQGAAAASGTAGSSAQAAALAQAQNEFQGTVTQAGLNIGLTSQTNQANALQQQINALYGQTNTAMGIKGSAASQQSQQQLGESELIGSLPSFMNAQALETGAYNTAATKGTTFQDTFDQVTGDINASVDTIGNLLTLGKNISTPIGSITSNPSGTASGGSLAAGASSGTSGSTASMGAGGSNYQSPNLNAPGYNEFASTGSMFGS